MWVTNESYVDHIWHRRRKGGLGGPLTPLIFRILHRKFSSQLVSPPEMTTYPPLPLTSRLFYGLVGQVSQQL